MKIQQWLGLLIAPALLLGNFSASVAQKPFIQDGPCLHLIQSSNTEAVVEVNLGKFRAQPVQIGGMLYQEIQVPNMANKNDPGAPQLPVCSTMLGVASTQGLKVEVIEAEYETRSGYRIAPGPTYQVLTPLLEDLKTQDLQPQTIPDGTIYGVDQFTPVRHRGCKDWRHAA